MGIGKYVDEDELSAIASSKKHVLKLRSFSELKFDKNIIENVCRGEYAHLTLITMTYYLITPHPFFLQITDILE